VAESETAVRSVPTGAAGIKALPTTAEVEEVGAAPSLGKLVSEETEEGTAKYLSALTGLRLAEEAASSVTEAAPELLRVGVRAATNVLPTQPPTPSISMRSISTTTPITQLPTTLGISTKGVSAATPTVQLAQLPKAIETQLQPITVETQPVQAPRQQPIQPTPTPSTTSISGTKTTETEVSSVTQPPTPSISTRSVGITTLTTQPSPSIEEQLQPTQTPSPAPISATVSTKTTETEVQPTPVPIVSPPTTPTTGTEVTEATGAVVQTPRLQPPTTTTTGAEAAKTTGTGVVASGLLPAGSTTLTAPPTTQAQQQQQQQGQGQGQGVGEEVGSGAGEYLSTLAGLGLGGGTRVGGVPMPVIVAGGGATEEETASEETEGLRGGRIPITPVRGSVNEEPVLGALPGNLREEAGNLLSFSWYGPGRINASPPGVLGLLRALAPPGQPTTEQYYTQMSPITLAPVEIPPPPLPPVAIQEAPTTGQENPPLNPPTTATPIPPTAIPPPPPFLIPLLWFPSWMPQPQTTTGTLARPGTMREILVL
jgi:hypothetical protein